LLTDPYAIVAYAIVAVCVNSAVAGRWSFQLNQMRVAQRAYL
jgi:hypothetical protein